MFESIVQLCALRNERADSYIGFHSFGKSCSNFVTFGLVALVADDIFEHKHSGAAKIVEYDLWKQ